MFTDGYLRGVGDNVKRLQMHGCSLCASRQFAMAYKPSNTAHASELPSPTISPTNFDILAYG